VKGTKNIDNVKRSFSKHKTRSVHTPGLGVHC